MTTSLADFLGDDPYDVARPHGFGRGTIVDGREAAARMLAACPSDGTALGAIAAEPATTWAVGGGSLAGALGRASTAGLVAGTTPVTAVVALSDVVVLVHLDEGGRAATPLKRTAPGDAGRSPGDLASSSSDPFVPPGPRASRPFATTRGWGGVESLLVDVAASSADETLRGVWVTMVSAVAGASGATVPSAGYDLGRDEAFPWEDEALFAAIARWAAPTGHGWRRAGPRPDRSSYEVAVPMRRTTAFPPTRPPGVLAAAAMKAAAARLRAWGDAVGEPGLAGLVARCRP